MPTPERPRPPGSRHTSARPAAAAPAGRPTGRSGGRAAARAAPPKKQGLLFGAIGGGAAAIGIVAFLLMRGGGDDEEAKRRADAKAAREAVAKEEAAAEAAKEEAAKAEAARVAAEAAKPKPPPLPDPAALRKKIRTAASADEAATLARDADRLNDAALSEECWTRVYELDAANAEAHAKLDVRRLEPASDCPGYSALAATSKLQLEKFDELARGERTKAGRAELVKQWEELRPALEERATKAKSNPYYGRVDEFRAHLKTIKFFDELPYEMVESKPPYALFVEVSGTPEEREKRRKAVEEGYTPYLEAYDARIRAWLFPLCPKPPKEDPLLPVFVFLNEQRYRDYQMADRGDPGKGSTRAHYEPWKKQCFTWTTVIKPGLGAFEEGVQVLLHELTHAWVDQLASGDGGETRTIQALATHWFSEGIAEYMRFHFREKLGGQISYQYQPWRSSRLGETGRSAKLRLGLKRALALPPHGLDAAAALLARDVPESERAGVIGQIGSGFYADMSNFILWLNFPAPDGAGLSKQFKEYAKAEMSGEGGEAAFKRCFPGLIEQGDGLDAKVDAFVLQIASGKLNPYKVLRESGVDW